MNYQSTGKQALALTEAGTGFVYYPNGSIACCSSPQNDYQNCYYAFDKNRQGTPIMAFDVKGHGFCSTTKRKGTGTDHKENLVCVTERGCLVEENGSIIREWLWDRTDSHCGEMPTDYLVYNLNEHITVRLKSRTDMYVDFSCENIKHSFNMGAKQKRKEPSYLVTAKRQVGGRLLPQIEHVSLITHTNNITESMKAVRNKLYPKSDNLTDMVKHVVADLEKRFDGISEVLKSTPTLDATKCKFSCELLYLNVIQNF